MAADRPIDEAMIGAANGMAITAATLNAACTLGRGGTLGTIEEGKQADLVVHGFPNRYHLVYRFGAPRVKQVIAAGRPVWPTA